MDEAAITDERTRTFIRRGARWAALFEVAGILMLIAFLVSVIRIGNAGDDLRDHGVKTTGTITGRTEDSGHTEGAARVTYRAGDRTLTEPVALGDDVNKYSLQQRVTVYYSRTDPTHMTIDDEANESAGSVPLVVGALVLGVFLGLIAGPMLINRWGAIRAVATHTPWRQVEATTWTTSSGRMIFRYVDEHGVEHVLRSGGLIPQARVGVQTGTFSFGDQPTKQRAIMTAPDLRTIVLLKQPLGPQQAARWLRTKPQVTTK